MTSILIGFTLFVGLLYYLHRKGKLGSYPGAAGNALVQLHTFARPATQYVVEAKRQRKTQSKQGDDGPPELPPWAESGDK